MAALRLLSVGSLIALVNAQWTYDALTDRQQQIITCTRNDINEDGFVGVDDLLMVLSGYHEHCGDDHGASFDYETCDYYLPGETPDQPNEALCGSSDECPNHPAPEPSPATEPCPAVTPCPAPAPPPSCPIPETCACLSHVVDITPELAQDLFGNTGCMLTPSELAADSAARSIIDSFLGNAAAELGVSSDAVVLEGTGPNGELYNTACNASSGFVAHEIAIELDNDLATAISQDDCSMDSNEIADSAEAQALTCAMAKTVAASLPGVNCEGDNCEFCDIVFDELTFSNSGSCSGGCTDDTATAVATATQMGIPGVTGCSDVADYCDDATYGSQVQNICPITCGACTGRRRRLALASSDGKTRAHLKLDQRFTTHVNAVFDSVKVATEKGLETAAAKRRL